MSEILITGGTGLVGSAIEKLVLEQYLQKENTYIFQGRRNTKILTSEGIFEDVGYDLSSQERTKQLFKSFRPDKVLHLAARVGGVKINQENNFAFFIENQQINTNVLNEASKLRIKTFISLLSTCIFPELDPKHFPLTECKIHKGKPHHSNRGYAHSKRMLEVATSVVNEQYSNTNWKCLIPNNIMGEEDNFDLYGSHVIPALIRKAYEGNKTFEVWGEVSNMVRRNFTYSKDLAKILLWSLKNNDKIQSETMIIGSDEEVLLSNIVFFLEKRYNKKAEWKNNNFIGQREKPISNKKFLEEYRNIEGQSFEYTPFYDALENTCQWFDKTYPNIRGI